MCTYNRTAALMFFSGRTAHCQGSLWVCEDANGHGLDTSDDTDQILLMPGAHCSWCGMVQPLNDVTPVACAPKRHECPALFPVYHLLDSLTYSTSLDGFTPHSVLGRHSARPALYHVRLGCTKGYEYFYDHQGTRSVTRVSRHGTPRDLGKEITKLYSWYTYDLHCDLLLELAQLLDVGREQKNKRGVSKQRVRPRGQSIQSRSTSLVRFSITPGEK